MTTIRGLPPVHLVDADGRYLGAFSGAQVPVRRRTGRRVKIGERVEPVTEMVERTRTVASYEADRVVLTTVVETVPVPVVDQVPVVDEEGNPVIHGGVPITTAVPRTEVVDEMEDEYEDVLETVDPELPEGAVEVDGPPPEPWNLWDGVAWQPGTPPVRVPTQLEELEARVAALEATRP